MPHIFISYLSNNKSQVDRLCRLLKAGGVNFWLDRNDISPGKDYKIAIREAIRTADFFIACFSKHYNERDRNYMKMELKLAAKMLNDHSLDSSWFIPVLLSKCEIPALRIGTNRTIRNLQYVELYKDWNGGVKKILDLVGRKDDTVPIEVIIDRPFSEFSERGKDPFLRALRIHIKIGDTRIVSIKPGSVKVTLELTPDDADKLLSAEKSGSLKKYGVVSATFINPLPGTPIFKFLGFDFPADYHYRAKNCLPNIPKGPEEPGVEDIYGQLGYPPKEQGFPILCEYPWPEPEDSKIWSPHDQIVNPTRETCICHTGRLSGSFVKYIVQSHLRSRVIIQAHPLDHPGSIITLYNKVVELVPQMPLPDQWFWLEPKTESELLYTAKAIIGKATWMKMKPGIYKLVVQWEFWDYKDPRNKTRLPMSGFCHDISFELGN